MGRKTRYAAPGLAYHVVNRGNDRQTVFRQHFDYAAFVELLAAGIRHHAVRVFGYCLMPNHFHLVVQPDEENALSAFMQWTTCRYACTFRQQTETVGNGHVFQRRFWSAALHDDRAFLSVLRYVEGNPSRAALVERAEHWEWSSLSTARDRNPVLSELPVALPMHWSAFVNAPLPENMLSRIRRGTVPSRGRPLAGLQRV